MYQFTNFLYLAESCGWVQIGNGPGQFLVSLKTRRSPSGRSNPTGLGQELRTSNNPGRLLFGVSTTTAPLTLGQEIGAPIVPEGPEGSSVMHPSP